MKVLTNAGLTLLAEAVSQCEAWRGAMVGNPDPQPLADFDAEVAAIKEALQVVGEQQRIFRKIRKGMRAQGDVGVTVYCRAKGGNGNVDILSFQVE